MIPLAMSSAGWTAVGAVGGALVGACAGGLVDWWLGLRKQRAEARAGARVVGGQISAAESQVAEAEKNGEWWAFYGVPIDSWPQYRDVLAVKLKDPDAFSAVGQCVLALESLRQKLPASPRAQQEFMAKGYLTIDRSTLRPIREEAAKAWNALAPIANEKNAGKVIERD